MSWGLGWKRPSEIFHLTLSYGNDDPPESLARTSTSSRSSSASSSSSSSSSSSIVSQDQDLGFRIELDWSSSDDEDQVALKLQSQLMVALPMPQDTVVIELMPMPRDSEEDYVDLSMKVVKRRDPLRGITMAKAVNSGLQSDGTGVLTRLLRSEMVSTTPEVDESVPRGGGHHWTSLAVLSICGCGLSVFPVELTQLPHIEKLYLNNNKLTVLPHELGELRSLRVLRVDDNMLVYVPGLGFSSWSRSIWLEHESFKPTKSQVKIYSIKNT